MTDRGAAQVPLVMLLVGATLMVGLAVGISNVVVAWRQADHLASAAAEAGAGWIDPVAALTDVIVLDVDSAEAAAERIVRGRVTRSSFDSQPARICVTTWVDVDPGLLAIVGAATKTVSATACAEPRRG